MSNGYEKMAQPESVKGCLYLDLLLLGTFEKPDVELEGKCCEFSEFRVQGTPKVIEVLRFASPLNHKSPRQRNHTTVTE